MSGTEYFTAHKAISIVRHPIDAIVSFAHLWQVGSHSVVPQEKYHEAFPEWWKVLVEQMMQLIKQSHEKMTSDMANIMPVYFLRYEDLVLNPEPVLMEMFLFLLEAESLEGTVVQKRIRDVTSTTQNSVYKLK